MPDNNRANTQKKKTYYGEWKYRWNANGAGTCLRSTADRKKNKIEHCERVSFHTNKNLCINIAQHHRAHIICMRYILEFRHNATTKTSRRVKEHKNKCRKNNNNNKKQKRNTSINEIQRAVQFIGSYRQQRSHVHACIMYILTHTHTHARFSKFTRPSTN